MTRGPLVSSDWLREHLERDALVTVDCRFSLGDPGAGARAYAQGHIPGARFLDLDTDLASEPGASGRHPLPSARGFEASLRRAGIGAGEPLVAYDECGEGGAARFWWVARHFGRARVCVLDGGLARWRSTGGALTSDVPAPRAPAEPFVARARSDDAIDADRILAAAGELTLLDARVPERFRGDAEPLDPVAGHIPGAKNLPFTDVAPGGAYRSAEELRAMFAERGAVAGRPTALYCGSGVTASVLAVAAETAGLEGVRLYPGSWSEWSGRGLPSETGE